MVNGKQKGWKKILVLYTNFGKNRKSEKTNWVMHQYHLGQHEEEKEGELVVSKIFYQTQPRQCNWSSDRSAAIGEAISTDPVSRRESESGSSSSKEVITQRDELYDGHAAHGVAATLSSYSTMDMQQLKSDHFSFVPFRKSFDEVGVGEASTARDTQASRPCEEHDMLEKHQRQHHVTHQHPHHQHQIATAAYHIRLHGMLELG